MKSHRDLQDFLNSIHGVEEGVLEAYLSHWKEYQVPKKHIMTAPGETERYLYFVCEGIQKSYYMHGDKIHVIAFTYPPSFSGIPESFLTQTPSNYYLETISDSVFLRISHDRHMEMLSKHRSIETLFRKGTEQLLIGIVQRHYELMAFDIEARFKAFAQRSPHLLNMLSQKDIASYLRIDPTNLSKLINTISI